MAAQISYSDGEQIIIRKAAGYKTNDVKDTWDFYTENGEFLESIKMDEGAEIHIIDEPSGE